MVQHTGRELTDLELYIPKALLEGLLAGAIVRVRAGDRASFEILFLHYDKPIWNHLLRLVGNKEVAEDLRQETFVRAWTNLPKMGDDMQFGPWLHRIAANVAIDYLRREEKFEFLPFQEDELEGSTTVERLSVKSPEEEVCEKDAIEQALAHVSPQSLICLLLQDQWGFSQREIAELLNISVSCVGSYISRGREQFRRAYRSRPEANEKGGLR